MATTRIRSSFSYLLNLCIITFLLLIAVAASPLPTKFNNDQTSSQQLSTLMLQQEQQSHPRNITSSYKGTWYRTDGTLYTSLIENGIFSFNIKAEDVIARRYHFIEGRAGVRDGIYLHNKLYQFTVRGIYDLDTAKLYFYLIPSAFTYKTLHAKFNNSEVNTAYDIGASRSIIKAIQAQLASGTKLREDFTNLCIYQGSATVVPLMTALISEDPFLASRKPTAIATSEDGNSILILSITGSIQAVETCRNNTMTLQMDTWVADHYYARTTNYTLMISIFAILEILAFIAQQEHAKTQTTAARVSLLTIAQQAMIDSYICLMHLTLGIFLDGVFKAFAVAAFLKFTLFSIFELRYMLFIWKSRNPQAFSQWASMRRELQTLYIRFYGGLFIGLIILYQFNQFFHYFIFVLYAFWVPQIYCNFSRDAPKSLHPLYIIITSIARLAMPLYLFGCPHNFIGFEPNYYMCICLVFWVTLQASILLLQNKLGPRFCIPKFFLPAKYNYKRPIPPELLEDGECNCVICMHAVDDNDYLVTPCNHVFHSECLQRWMDEKMECPTCRASPLPEL